MAEVTETDERERAKAERARHLAGLGLPELLAEASDAELASEQRRISQAMGKIHLRQPGVAHAKAVERLDRGVARLSAHRRACLDEVRREAVSRPDGVRTTTLVAFAGALQAERMGSELREVLAGELAPNGSDIHEKDPKADAIKQRRELDTRSAECGVELRRREVERQAAGLPKRPTRKAKK